MSIEMNNKYGSIVISPDIIAEVAENAAAQCYGLIGFSTRSTKSVVNILRREPAKGIEVAETPEGIKVTLHVIIQYGVNMAVVAENIMDSVKYQIEHQLGVVVNEVNVSIENVRMGG